eukprot:9015739-Pyramimonas_sp.AAC.1
MDSGHAVRDDINMDIIYATSYSTQDEVMAIMRALQIHRLTGRNRHTYQCHRKRRHDLQFGNRCIMQYSVH